MSRDWKFVKLKDVCQVVTGSTPKTNIPEYWDGEYPWVTPAELKGEKYISDTERHITDDAVDHTNLTLMPVGTVLLSSRAPIGKVAITEAEMYCNQGFKNLICSDKIDNQYLYLWLSSQTDYLNSLGRGATFKEISKTIVENIEVPLTSIEKQREIVAELELIKTLINLKRKQLDIYDKLAQSIFYEMFGDPVENEKGWEVKKWKDVFDTRTGKLDSNAAVSNGKYPFFTCAKTPFTIDTYAFDCKALLLAGNNASADYDVKFYNGKFNAYQRTYVLTLKDNSQNYQLYKFQLEHRLIELKHKSLGINTKYLTLKILDALQFIIPPLSLQQTFAARIEAIEKQKTHVRAAIEKLETLLSSRMDYWFVIEPVAEEIVEKYWSESQS